MPKWMPGASRVPCGELAEHAARVREDESVVVGGRQGAGPRVEQLERPAPASSWVSMNVIDIDARRSIRSCHSAVSLRMSAFVCSYVRLGRPSIR